METKTIENTLISLIKEELDVDTSQEIELTSTLSSIGVDSIAMMTLLVFIEEKFDFTVDEDVLISNRFITVSDIFDYINEKISNNM